MAKLKDAHQQFVNHLSERKRSAATILAYGKDIEQLVSFLEDLSKSEAHEIQKEDLEAFMATLAEKGYTPKSISRKTNSTKTFFRFLKINEFVTDDPATLLAHPKFETPPPRILSKLEYRALRDAARSDTRISTIIEILLQTGIRIGELANLHIEDLDLESKEPTLTVRPNEGHPERLIPLNRPAIDAIKRYLEVRPNTQEPKLFVTKTGRPLLIRNIRTAIDRYFRLAGIKDAKVNDLRHTFVAHHLMSGTSLVVVSKLAGHKRLATTEKYLEFIKNHSEKGLKLGEL
jgi:site-specific recombinase XerD